MAHKKYTIDIIIKWLKEYGSCNAIETAGFATSDTCIRYLKAAGIDYQKIKPTSEEKKKIILEKYESYRDMSCLSQLAVELNTSYDVIKRIARKNNLTDKGKNSEIVLIRHKQNGHPMLGVEHKKESKDKMSNASKNLWAKVNSPLRTDESLQKRSDKQTVIMGNLENKKRHSRCNSGWFEKDNRLIFMRSSWELNYAHYLNFLVKHKQIYKWEYEVDTFWFEKIKRGVRSYKPDFKVYSFDKTFEYHEVKGWMDKASVTKLKRMKLYHPLIKIVVVGEKQYKAIKSKAQVIDGWGKWVTEKPTKETASK